MKRTIISIDPEKCDGCGLCVDACAESAIQLVNGKARLIRDDYCDGLGACLGDCPQSAITLIEREADAFNSDAVEAHLQNKAKPQPADTEPKRENKPFGCPGMAAFSFEATSECKQESALPANGETPSALRQWPIQLALVPIQAPYWNQADLLLAADCTAFSLGGFHARLLAGRRLIIACPKLDDTRGYQEKLTAILAQNEVRSLTVARMEVPCCGGLTRLAQEALAHSGKDIPFETLTIGIHGDAEIPHPDGKEIV